MNIKLKQISEIRHNIYDKGVLIGTGRDKMAGGYEVKIKPEYTDYLQFAAEYPTIEDAKNKMEGIEDTTSNIDGNDIEERWQCCEDEISWMRQNPPNIPVEDVPVDINARVLEAYEGALSEHSYHESELSMIDKDSTDYEKSMAEGALDDVEAAIQQYETLKFEYDMYEISFAHIIFIEEERKYRANNERILAERRERRQVEMRA